MSETLKEKTAKGLFWGAVNSGGTQILSLVVGIFLARLLSPSEYGIIGMLAIFMAVAANIQDCGFANALINQKEVRHEDYNSVFWFNVVVSGFIYVLLFLSAPLIASFFRQPVLVPLSRLLFLSLILSALGIAHNAYLTRMMMNREKAYVALVSVVISGTVGIVLAWRDMSYWSLAWQQLIYNLVTCIGRAFFSRWHPDFHIDFRPVKRMFRFSSRILITSLVNTVNQNVLSMVFGRFYHVNAVGNFTQASKWENMAHGFMNMTVAHVAQPVLATLGDEQERQLRAFRKMLRFTAFISFPVMFFLALVAREFIVLAISEKWLDAVPLLQILCLSGAFAPFYVLYQHLSISKGRSDIYMWCTIVLILCQTVVIVVFHQKGILTMVWAYTIVNILYLLLWQLMARQMIGLKWIHALQDILPFMLASGFVVVVIYFATRGIANNVVLLLVRIVLTVILYFYIMKLFRAKILDESVEFFKRKM